MGSSQLSVSVGKELENVLNEEFKKTNFGSLSQFCKFLIETGLKVYKNNDYVAEGSSPYEAKCNNFSKDDIISIVKDTISDQLPEIIKSYKELENKSTANNKENAV